MKIGEIVEIFSKPVTKEKPEGKAEIKFIWSETKDFVSASVIFLDEKESGTFHRIIYK